MRTRDMRNQDMKKAIWVLVLLAFVSCSKKEDAPLPMAMTAADQEEWEIALVEARIEKNEVYADSAQTVLPRADLADFVGLNYYFPEQGLRFRVPLVSDARTDTVLLNKRKGEKVSYVRKGGVTIGHEGKPYTLSVFGPSDTRGGDYLWLPFYDLSNGEDTYPGGRYLDLELAADGTVLIDFNFAYNPLCAYNATRYNCTLPPEENRLPFAVVAGEKLYGSEH